MFIRLQDSNIHIMDAACTRSQTGCTRGWSRLTDATLEGSRSKVFAYDLSTSRDGRRVAFTYSENIDELGTSRHTEVRILDVDKCSSLPAGCTLDQTSRLAADRARNSYGAAWSPTGDELALMLNDPDGLGLAVMRADGSGYTVIFENHQLARDANLESLDWAPNGQRLAFTATYGTVRNADSYIFTINRDGSDVKKVTDFPHVESYHAIDGSPQWSPDSEKILFISNHRYEGWEKDPEFYLYTMNADGSDVTPLGIEALFATWSPDGSQILYINNSGDLYLIDAQGGQPVQLTKGLNISAVTWIP